MDNTIENKISIDALKEFSRLLSLQDISKLIKWFNRNNWDFQKAELIFIVRQLLYSIQVESVEPSNLDYLPDIAEIINEYYEF